MVAEQNSISGPVALAITGASGSLYGLRLLECLIRAERQVYLMISKAGQVVIPIETALNVPSRAGDAEVYLSRHFGAAEGQLRVFGREQWTAPVASGSNAPQAMVVCPCSTGTLSAIATGASNNLIERAADVALKEQRKLILMVRETPFSAVHLENMLKLARLGVVIMPASPGFYHRPESVDDLVDFMVARVLDHLGIDAGLARRWGED
ncbi:MAG: aromatic acid decarboxylase [Sedimenticola sp.]|nr:MAG: aromatic acid decarboxylase [Sedimenticola sp.]